MKDKVPLTVKGKYSDGRDEIVIVEGVRWQSSNGNIAEVNSRGVLEGKKEGQVEITASYAGVNTVYTVYIKGVEVEKPKDSGTPIRDKNVGSFANYGEVGGTLMVTYPARPWVGNFGW